MALSLLTVVTINGILSFMFNPGAWVDTGLWYHGFFNLSYLPSLLMRLAIMASLAGIYALISFSSFKETKFRRKILRYSSKWILAGFISMPILATWLFKTLAQEARDTIITGIRSPYISEYFAPLSRITAISLVLIILVILLVYFGPYRNPKNFSIKLAVFISICVLFVTISSEWLRRAIRRPYLIQGYMYANGILKRDIRKINLNGYISSAKWAKDSEEPEKIGEQIFRDQCSSCHSPSGMKGLISERDYQSLEAFLFTIHETNKEKNPYIILMPPLAVKKLILKHLLST